MVGRAAVMVQTEQPEEEPELPSLALTPTETYRDVKVTKNLDISQKAQIEKILSDYQERSGKAELLVGSPSVKFFGHIVGHGI
ncbi:hypothetical protein MTO96_046382 [Rhipicephalus appendiculatus]